MKYPYLHDYEPITLNAQREILRFACCDCGATHDIKIIKRRGLLVDLVFRSRKASTAQLRRWGYGKLQRNDKNYKMIKI